MKKYDFSLFLSSKVKAFESKRDRDPVTKILKGAEPLELGNPNSNLALLLIHGFAGCPNNFEKLPYYLADNLKIYIEAMLLPGHGRTSFEFEKISSDILLDAVIDKIIKLKKNYKKVIVLSHSMGGTLAILANVKTVFDGLILASPYFRLKFNPKLIFPPEKWIKALAPFVRWVYTAPSEQPIFKKEIAEQIISYHWLPSKAGLIAIELAERASRDSIIQQIQIPVLVIHSVKDSVACPKAVEEIFSKIPSEDKKIIWLHNSDHVIFWDYDKELVFKSIEDFVKKFM